MSFNFDDNISRTGTDSLKYDGRVAVFGNDDVLPMWVADMDFATPDTITQALTARATHPIYGYTVPPESLYDALIGWMKQRHHWQVEREWIMLTPGVVPSLNATVMALTRPDEGVIVQPPVYFPFFSAVTNTSRRLIENPLRLEKNRYIIDFEHLEQCASRACLLLLCSPHNPVSRVWQKDELAQVLDIASRHKLTIISDEIHADLIYPEFQHQALATLTDNPSNIITAISPSKTFNIAGLGLSALIVADPIRRAAIQKILDMIHMSAANPFSLVAFEAAYRSGSAWIDSLLTYLQTTRDAVVSYIRNELPEIGIIQPEGTYLIWLDCRGLGMCDLQLQQFLVNEAKVGLSAGISFGAGGEGFMRMNIGMPRKNVMAALKRIRDALER